MFAKLPKNDKALEKLVDLVKNKGLTYGGTYERLEYLCLCRGCATSDECATEALYRVADKIAEGEKIDNLEAYLTKFAKNIAYECRRENQRDTKATVRLDDPKNTLQPEMLFNDPFDKDESLETELRRKCAEECRKALPEKQQNLILGYYVGEKRKKINNRKRLAKKYGISENALKIQTTRIRKKIKDCTKKCLRDLKSSIFTK